MINYTSAPTSMAHSSHYATKIGDKLNDIDSSLYRRLIIWLIYLCNIQLDITFVVHQLCQFVSSDTTYHQQATFRILIYLKGGLVNNIFVRNNNIVQLKTFRDFEWATCPQTHKFVTSYSVYLGDYYIMKIKEINHYIQEFL